MKHYPVMLPEVLTALVPKDGEIYVDGTFGNGGYSEAFLKATNCRVVGLDRDHNVQPRANVLSERYDGRFRWIETPFSKMDEVGLSQVDAVVLDIGVSSMQLDQAERGFSMVIWRVFFRFMVKSAALSGRRTSFCGREKRAIFRQRRL
jgi:16S rRNA (cytosine1402-N4)-methyltransferase